MFEESKQSMFMSLNIKLIKKREKMNIDEAELASLSPDSTFFVFNPCFQIIFFSRFKLRATASCVVVVRKTIFSFDN